MKFNDANWPIALSEPIGNRFCAETGQFVTLLSLMYSAQCLGDITETQRARLQSIHYDPPSFPFSIGLLIDETQGRDQILSHINLFFPDPELGTLSFGLRDSPQSKISHANKVVEWSWCDYHGPTDTFTIPLNSPIEATIASSNIAGIVDRRLAYFDGLIQNEAGIWVMPSLGADQPADES